MAKLEESVNALVDRLNKLEADGTGLGNKVEALSADLDILAQRVRDLNAVVGALDHIVKELVRFNAGRARAELRALPPVIVEAPGHYYERNGRRFHVRADGHTEDVTGKEAHGG